MNSPNMVVLNRARTTFQRISDGRFFNGWVKRITPDTVIAHTCTNSQLQIGDEFAFQVYGNHKDAFFHGRLVSLQGSEQAPVFATDRSGTVIALELGCTITTEMVFKDGQHQPRFCVEGISADILSASANFLGATVVDIGPGGMAAITSREFRKGDAVRVQLFARGQIIQCDAEVRNCVVNALNIEYQRTGMQIRGMQRVDALRWNQLYTDILDANRMNGILSTAEIGTVVKRKARRAA